MTPTARSKGFLAENGMPADICERWIAMARIRKDLFGIADLVALDGRDVVFVQTTSASNVIARMKKIQESEFVLRLLACGRIQVHGWGKRGKRGQRKLWSCRIVEAQLDGNEIRWASRESPSGRLSSLGANGCGGSVASGEVHHAIGGGQGVERAGDSPRGIRPAVPAGSGLPGEVAP